MRVKHIATVIVAYSNTFLFIGCYLYGEGRMEAWKHGRRLVVIDKRPSPMINLKKA
jgi:hypothetical protein